MRAFPVHRPPPRPGRSTPRRRLTLALASLLLAVPPALARAETITVAAEDDWAPYAFVAPGTQQPQGLAVDIVREAFATQGVEVRFVGVPFARCLHLARTGQVAGCFNATQVSDLREAYVWHTTPMFQEELAIFGRKGGTRTDLGLAGLEGKRVGYTLGYTYPPEFRHNPRIEKVAAKGDQQLLELLHAGRIDYILANTAPLWLRLSTQAALRAEVERVGVISQDGFWLAFTREDTQGQRLAARFEEGLAVLRANGRLAAMQAALRKRLGY